MIQKRSEASVTLFIVVAVFTTLVAGATAVEASDGPPSWCSSLGSPKDAGAEAMTLVPRQARYEIDLLGNLAVGTLALEFTNSGVDDRAFRLSARRPDGVQLDSLAVGPEAADDSRPLEYDFARTAKRDDPRGRRKQATVVPKAFTSDVLELEAEDTIWVRIGFTAHAKFETDRFQMSLPAVGGACVAPRSGVPEGLNAAAPLSIVMRIHHDQPLEVAESLSHSVLVEFEGDYTIVELVEPDPLGQSAFEFSYALGGADEPVLTGFATPEGEGGERDVLLVFSPSVAPDEETVRPKEVLFVLDTSGSMRGPKIQVARDALVACLQRLHDVDRFNLVEFDGSFTMLFEEPQEASRSALETSGVWLSGQKTGGSTTLLPALAAAFEQERGPGHHRLVVVLTDGAIGDHEKVRAFLQETLGEARLFFVGVGEEPNREAVRRLAEYGRGTAAFADDPEGLGVAVQQLFDGISAPLAWDLSVDWAGAEVIEMRPQRLPDLYVGRPVAVQARVRGELPPTLVLQAETTGGMRTFEALLPAGGALEFPQLKRLQKRTGSSTQRRSGSRR